MKRIAFSRKAILRAIHAACVALFLFAAQRGAEAQSYTAPFQVSGSTVTTASGTFGTGSGLYEPATTYSTFTIGSGTTINSTIAYAGNGSGYNHASSLITTAASTFSNAGSLTLSGTYGAGSGTFQAVVNLQQGATSLTATNSGSISASLAGGTIQGSRDSALFAETTTGAISVTNSGSLSLTSGSYSGTALLATSSSGNISITNTSGGTISLPVLNGYCAGVGVTTTNGSATFLNAGTISATLGSGEYATDIVGVSVQMTNTGSISGAACSMSAYGTSVSVVNSGTVSGGTFSGIYGGGDTISINNSGTISNTASAIYVGQSAGTGPIHLINSGTITSSGYGMNVAYADSGSLITLTNSGSITATDYGIFSANVASVVNSGDISAPTAISVPSGSSVTLEGRPNISGTIVGGATSASTSQLVFNLAVPAANLVAAQAQLNSDLAAYAMQMGGTYTFTIDGLTYEVSNFDYDGGVIDDLMAEAAARIYANTPGYRSEGTVLDNLNMNNPQASKILTALGNVPDAGVAHALAELSPKELEIFSNVANNNATFNVAKINNHLANLRDGLTGFDATALSVQDSGMDPTLNQVRDHLLAYNPAATPGLMSDTVDSLFGGTDMKDTRVNTMPVDRWSTFIAGDVVLADLSHNANLDDADYTTGNITAGADYRLDEHFTVGGLFTYAHTDADLDSRGSSATVDSYSPGLYGSYVDGPWYGNFLGAYGRNAYTSDREIDIVGLGGDNHGATSGDQGTINFTGGYEFQRGAFKFGPVASVQYVHLSIDSMQEDGPTALSIGSQDEDSFRSQLGVEGRFNANVGPVSLTPHVSASWQHEYLDDSRGINAQFTGTGGGSFVTQTDSPDRDSAFLDVGLDATVSKNVTLFVDYEAQAGQSDFFAQSAQGGVKIGF